MILKANCKINLGLDILRRRADGFHDLETVMFPVAGLYDEVEVVRTAAPGAEFRAEGLAVDCAPGENICLKAFRLMQRHYGVDGVAIRLGKRVPFGAGLGGGSSDGTAVLLAVNELFALGLSEAELIARAAELGIDVIITDHHECKQDLPQAWAVVDPHRPDCPYPFKHLAGVGVALKLVLALGGQNREDALFARYCTLAAIGTVADVERVTGHIGTETRPKIGRAHV